MAWLMQDYDFEYEEDDDGEDADAFIENTYYNAKGRWPSNQRSKRKSPTRRLRSSNRSLMPRRR